MEDIEEEPRKKKMCASPHMQYHLKNRPDVQDHIAVWSTGGKTKLLTAKEKNGRKARRKQAKASRRTNRGKR